MAKAHSPNEAGTPAEYREMFQSDETLHFDDGRWGLCGYAIPNCAGKTWTNNANIFAFVKLVGRAMFHMAHQSAVQFEEPPHKDFWWEWHKALISARDTLQNHRLDPGTTVNLAENHVSSTPETYIVYPVPHFGGRVRQEDLRFLISMTLKLLGHVMQHSANEKSYYITGNLVDSCVGFINEMLRRVAEKYFNYTVEEIALLEPNFVIETTRFDAINYRPQDRIPSTEMSTERPPRLWWPTENDLSAIKGIPLTTAMRFAKRWPMDFLEGEGDWEGSLPGIVDRVGRGDPINLGDKNKKPTGIKAP